MGNLRQSLPSRPRAILALVHPRKGVLLGLVAVAALLTVACSGAASGSSIGETQAADQPANTDVIDTIAHRLAANLESDFPVEFYQGEETFNDHGGLLSGLFDGTKPVILNFWAGSCPPCRAEMPDLDEFATAYADRVAIFGLDVGPFVGLGSREEGRALVKELGVTYPIGTTSDANVVREYEVFGMPTTVFFTSDGTIHESWTGLITASKLAELTDELLAAEG